MDALSRANAILRLSEAVSMAPAAVDVYAAGLDFVEQALDAKRAAILLLDESGRARFKAWRGLSDTCRAAIEERPPWGADSGATRPIAVADVALSGRLGPLRDAILAEGIRSLVVLPLRARGRLLGTLMLYGDRPQEHPEPWLAETQGAADQLALALDRHLGLDRQRDLNAVLVALIESLPDAVIYISGDGRVRYANARSAALFETAAANLTGFTGVELHRAARHLFTDPEGLLQRWFEDVASGRTVTREEHLVDGRVFERTHVPVPGAGDSPGRLLHLRDVTAKRRIEERLLQAQKLESVGRLAGGVAHDFNNMLTAMIGYMDLAASNLPETGEERAYLAQALEAAEQAADLTRQLLMFSRRQPAPPSPQDLDALLERMAPMIRRLVPESIGIVTRADAHPAWVRADAGQLEQLLVTLAFNARDAMPEGGLLTLSTGNPPEEDAESEGMVVLQVTDTGVGMDAETLRHAFEPFWTTKPQGQGTGLGLASVYGAVTGWGGRVEARSEPGRGATIRMLLPRVPAPAGQAAPAPDERARAGGGAVLLVEDDPSVRGLVTAMLERLGYGVLAAGRADEALRLIERPGTAVDLLVADIVMPGMSGRELAVRALARRPNLRVLLMSGYAPLQDDAALPGGFAFLPKPFSIETLARRVRETLAGPAPAAVTPPA